jgi:FecR protein
MRTSQAKHVHPSTFEVVAANSLSRRWTRMTVTLLAMAASLLFLACRCRALTTDTNAKPAVAQASSQSATAAGVPGPIAVTQNIRVVRLSDVEGTVQIVRNNQTEFSHAVMNMPLTEGTRIETGPDGRAEVEFEDGSVSRITPNSSLGLAKLSTSSTGTLETTLEQPKGLVYYELRSDPQSAFTVDFGGSKVTPTVNSTFRVNLGANPAELAVIDGHVQVQAANSETATAVPQGKTFELQPSGSSPYTITDGIIPNGFDQWNDQRDEEAAKQAASQTTARAQQGGGSMLEGGWGWGDLDAYGGWYPIPGYGMGWQPYGAGPGFDPYGYGSWAYMGGLGVSWVSGYPWGWLPFQCGGWSYIGNSGWFWLPGGGCDIWGPYGYPPYGVGGYYRGRYWHNHPGRNGYGHANPGWGRGSARIYSAPAGYHMPMAPASLRNGVNGGRPADNIVHVGSPAIAARGFNYNGHAENHARAIKFNGTKIEPLHSVMRGGNISFRNAALLNNAPARSMRGGMYGGRAGQNRGPEGNRALASRDPHEIGGPNEFRGTSRQMRASSFDSTRAANAAAFQNRSAFGNHATFGTHGSYHGSAPSYGGFHGAGMRGGSFGSARGSSGSGFQGGGGGFHGASAGGGSHGGGGGGGGSSLGGGGGGHAGGGGGGVGGGGGGHH